jgi:ABC-type Fe3+ transport system substrate-binding protein
MTASRIAVVLAFLLVLALPFLVRERTAAGPHKAPDLRSAQRLIVVTPHIEQIRGEFGAAFAAWHARNFPADAPVEIDWRIPGGTSEIVKQLSAQYEAAVRAAARDGRLPNLTRSEDGDTAEVTVEPRSMSCDLMFGGGSYEHGQLKRGITLKLRHEGRDITAAVRISEPADFPPERLIGSDTAWFNDNRIGTQTLFDPDQYWIGTALSAFGIVYNRLVLAELGLSEPRTFADLTDPRYAGRLALADPRQSGSITTTYESILNKEGWSEGWRILREMSANARSFAATSTKPPMDVSQGDAAAGLAIDFYGRGQAQAIAAARDVLAGSLDVDQADPLADRLGYVDPKGAVYVDADPVSILRGAPNPELARRFVEFCLTEEAQALWQFHPPSTPAGATNPTGEGGLPMGPRRHELRRLPVRQIMYEKYLLYFIDKVDPFELASQSKDRRWRSAIGMMMGAFAIDVGADLRAAWSALNRAGADPAFPRDRLDELRRLFHAFPTGDDVRQRFATAFPGAVLPAAAALDFSDGITDRGNKGMNPRDEDNCRRITATWSDPALRARLKIVYTDFFRANYRRVVELAGHETVKR